MKKRAVFFSILCLSIFTLSLLKIYKCPIKLIFGVSCPLCGFTRSINCLFHKHFLKSFYYHALWPIFVIILMLHIISKLNLKWFNFKKYYTFLYLSLFINLLYYIYRITNNSKIINIEFSKSIIYKIIQIVNHII